MNKVLKKIDWFQVGVITMGLAATLVKSIYESKRFDSNLNKRYDDNFEKRVEEIIDKKLKNGGK